MTKVSGANIPKKKHKKKKLRTITIILTAVVLVFATLSFLIACNATFILIALFFALLTILCFIAFFKTNQKPTRTNRSFSSKKTHATAFTASISKAIPELCRDLAFGCIVMTMIAVLVITLNHKTITYTQTTHETLEHAAESPANVQKFMRLLFNNDFFTVIPEPDSTNKVSDAPIKDVVQNTLPVENTSDNMSDNTSAITGDMTTNITNETANDLSDNNTETEDALTDNIGQTEDMLADNISKFPTTESNNSMIAEASSTINTTNEKPDNNPPLILDPYDFSPLYIWGTYRFGNTITEEDITNMQNMYNTFSENKAYVNMLELPEDDYGNYQDILNEVNLFIEKQIANGGLVTSEELYRNTMNRLYCYKQKGDVKNLEQSAISAEGALEKEKIADSGSYNNYIKYAKTTAINFFCVLDSDSQEYESGSRADIKFRIGKALYKPSANLKNITSNERDYSLCSAYLVSKEAFELSNSENYYAIDTAFYHLKICADLAGYMEPGTKRNEICRDASGAYAILIDRISESGKTIYNNYLTEAEQLLKKIDGLLSEHVEIEELDK